MSTLLVRMIPTSGKHSLGRISVGLVAGEYWNKRLQFRTKHRPWKDLLEALKSSMFERGRTEEAPQPVRRLFLETAESWTKKDDVGLLFPSFHHHCLLSLWPLNSGLVHRWLRHYCFDLGLDYSCQHEHRIDFEND